MTGDEARPHMRAVADVLHDLSLDVEMLGAMLCANAELMQGHVQELQTIDLIAQKQRSLAALLRADCPRSALSDICLDDLKSRLHELVEQHRTPVAPARLN